MAWRGLRLRAAVILQHPTHLSCDTWVFPLLHIGLSIAVTKRIIGTKGLSYCCNCVRYENERRLKHQQWSTPYGHSRCLYKHQWLSELGAQSINPPHTLRFRIHIPSARMRHSDVLKTRRTLEPIFLTVYPSLQLGADAQPHPIFDHPNTGLQNWHSTWPQGLQHFALPTLSYQTLSEYFSQLS